MNAAAYIAAQSRKFLSTEGANMVALLERGGAFSRKIHDKNLNLVEDFTIRGERGDNGVVYVRRDFLAASVVAYNSVEDAARAILALT